MGELATDAEGVATEGVSHQARLLRAPIRPGDLEGFAGPPEPEIERVAHRVRAMLGTESPLTPTGVPSR